MHLAYNRIERANNFCHHMLPMAEPSNNTCGDCLLVIYVHSDSAYEMLPAWYVCQIVYGTVRNWPKIMERKMCYYISRT